MVTITNTFLADDAPPPRITLTIDASLLDYFRSGMRRDRIADPPLEVLTEFLAGVLNDTAYPIEAHRDADGGILLSYQPRAFADPIF